MIQIKWNEIKKDIDKQTWRLAQVRVADMEQQNYAQEDESKSSLTYIMRYAESGIAMVKNAIKEELSVAVADATETDALDMQRVGWTFEFKNASVLDEHSVAMLIHKFVVAYILYRWAFVWAPDSAKGFKEMYEGALEEISDMTFMVEPVKRKRAIVDTSYNAEMEVSYE